MYSEERVYRGDLTSTYSSLSICAILVLVLASNGLDFNYLVSCSYKYGISLCIVTVIVAFASLIEFGLNYRGLCITYHMQVSKDSKILIKTFYAALGWIACATILFYLLSDFMQYYYVSHLISLSLQTTWLYLWSEILYNISILFGFARNKKGKSYILLGY